MAQSQLNLILMGGNSEQALLRQSRGPCRDSSHTAAGTDAEKAPFQICSCRIMAARFGGKDERPGET